MTGKTLDPDALASFVHAARAGDRRALEQVVRAVQDDVYRLALRMTACPDDALDACQEVLIKVVTRLDSFREESSVRTWTYRIAVRHLLDRKKSRAEALTSSFDLFGADLLDRLSDGENTDPLLAEEVKLGCTLAMLTCLDREHRLAFILADVFDLAHDEAAELCGVREDSFRQRLSRARRALAAFTEAYCGMVNDRAPCHCDKRVARALELGRIERDRPRLAQANAQVATREMESLYDAARLIRAHPRYAAPGAVLDGVRAAIAGGASSILGDETALAQ